MISICLAVEVGNLVEGEFNLYANLTLETHYEDEIEQETVNNVLESFTTDYPDLKYARLIISYEGGRYHENLIDPLVVATFKRIILKNKGYKWVLAN